MQAHKAKASQGQEMKLGHGIVGVLAEYGSPESLITAAHVVCSAGFGCWDTFSPFPLRGMDQAMGIRPTRLPWLVFVGGCVGGVFALAMQWYTNAVDYPGIASGKPLWNVFAAVPITFEMIILLSAIAAWVGMLLLIRLPHSYRSLASVRNFERATNDRFFVYIDATDPKFSSEQTASLLWQTGAVSVQIVREDPSRVSLPRWLFGSLVILGVASLIPFTVVAWLRNRESRLPRVHGVQDMDFQPKIKADGRNPFFQDGRASRPPVEGTIAVGDLHEDEHLYQGVVAGQPARNFPSTIIVDDTLFARGRVQFGIYCAPCHGLFGKSDGMISQRADDLAEGTWVPPSSLHQAYIRKQMDGQLFQAISKGIRNMPGYANQISATDRWAIVAYVRALQNDNDDSAVKTGFKAHGQVK